MTTTQRVAPQGAAGRWSDRLREVGLRVTRPRLAVLDVLEAESHLAADEIVVRVRDRLGTVSVQAVYDTLNVLADLRVLDRFAPGASAMRYEILRAGQHHHHGVCRGCGGVADVACGPGSPLCSVPAFGGPFVADEAQVVFWGLCDGCVPTSGHDAHAPPTSPADRLDPRSAPTSRGPA